MELINTLHRVIEENDDFYDTKDLVENKLYELKKLIFPKLQYNEFLGYDKNSFAHDIYQIYKKMRYHLMKDNAEFVTISSVRTLPNEDTGTIKITEVKN